jgi:hypothetical protein
MTGADSGSFFSLDFAQTGKKPFQKLGVLEINFLDIALTKITRHIKYAKGWTFSN